jgi:MmgE/PrpD N-terminal domain
MGRLADARPGSETKLSRRTMVLGGLGAAAAFPSSARAEAEDISPVMRKLSAYMSEAGQRALPDVVVWQAKYHILDTLAAMVSGSELPPGRQAMQFARAFGGQPIATVVASTILAGPLEAAIVNGALAQADETDDNYSAGGAHGLRHRTCVSRAR